MAYIVDKNPAGKNPNRGWVPNLRGLGAYTPSRNPAGKDPNRGWVPNLRGLGCGCKKTLGDDALYNGQNPDGSYDTSWIPAANMSTAVTAAASDIASNPNPFVMPGYYNNQPVYPSTPASSANPNLYSVPGAPPSTIYNASQQQFVPSTGILGASAVGGLSMSTIIIGGLGLVALVVIMGKKR
jgi:hypothetical protein